MEKDVLQILTENHAVLRWLGDRLLAARPGRVRTMLFNEIARALGAHQTVIDQTALPALKACGWRGVSSDMLAGHMALKRLLAETLTLERGDESFDLAVPRIVARTRAHCDFEQEKLLPLVHRLIDDEQRAVMASDAELHLTRLLGEPRSRGADFDLIPRAEDLLEEAYVVLGSLASSEDPPANRR
jgi:hypothetical protein